MINITIDHNQDLITITNSSIENKLEYKLFNKMGSTMEYRDFLIELLNLLEISDVTLKEIDEDVRRIVGEW